jgi:Rrf2 family protein
MKITAQEEYGLRCLLHLGRVTERASLTIPDIAASEGLSQAYVAKLLAVLRQAGLIESERGRAGGYRLARPAGEITLSAVLSVLGEPLFDGDGFCQKHSGTETTDGTCVHLSGCTLRVLWQTLENWMRQTLEGVTLADLLNGEDRVTHLLRRRLAEAVATSAEPLISLTMRK